MTDWKRVSIGDVLTLQRGFDITKADQRYGLVPVVSSGGISSYHDTAAVTGPGVVIGRKGTLGTAFYLPGDYWPHDTTLWVKDFKGNLPRFVYYFFTNLDIKGLDVGSANPTLNRNHVHPLHVRWPERRGQESIVAVLGALDDKIALNDRIARSARNLSRAYFRAAATEEDAEVVQLGSIAQFLGRGITPRYTEDDKQLRILNQKCIRDGRVNLSPSRRTIASPMPEVKMLKPDDVLVNSTGVGTLGRVARWARSEPCTVDSHVTIVRFDPGRTDSVCAAFGMLEAQPEIEGLGQGSTGQTELSRNKLAAIILALPSRDKAIELRPKIDALEGSAAAALEESLTLAELRDTLLPKLMSGGMQVRDAKKIAGEAT